MAVAFGTDEFQREVKFIVEIIGVRRGCTTGSVEKTRINSVKKYLWYQGDIPPDISVTPNC